jgi:hypothetical protein
VVTSRDDYERFQSRTGPEKLLPQRKDDNGLPLPPAPTDTDAEGRGWTDITLNEFLEREINWAHHRGAVPPLRGSWLQSPHVACSLLKTIVCVHSSWPGFALH